MEKPEIKKNCLNPKCNKEFTPKNAKGVYCSANCRAAHAYQMKCRKLPVDEKFTVELPKDFIGSGKVGLLKDDGTIEELKTTDQLPPEWAHLFKTVKQSLPAVKTFETPCSKLAPPSKEAETIERRITEIQNELKSPPKNPIIGLKRWVQVRENEIRQLKEKLK